MEEISTEDDDYSLDKFEGDVAWASYAEDPEYVVTLPLMSGTPFTG